MPYLSWETIKGPSEASLALTCLRPTSGLTLMTDHVYMTYFLGMHEVLAKTQEATRNKGSFLVVLWQACDHGHWHQDTHSGDRLDFVPTNTPTLWEPMDFCDFDTHFSLCFHLGDRGVSLGDI